MAAGEVPEADCRATGGAADAAEGAMAATARPAARIVRFIVRCLLGSVDVRKAFAAPAPRGWGSPLDHPRDPCGPTAAKRARCHPRASGRRRPSRAAGIRPPPPTLFKDMHITSLR